MKQNILYYIYIYTLYNKKTYKMAISTTIPTPHSECVFETDATYNI